MVERPIPGGNRPLARLLLDPGELRQVRPGGRHRRRHRPGHRRLLAALPRAGRSQADLNDKVVLVPGNHDLAFIDPWHGVFASGRALAAQRPLRHRPAGQPGQVLRGLRRHRRRPARLRAAGRRAGRATWTPGWRSSRRCARWWRRCPGWRCPALRLGRGLDGLPAGAAGLPRAHRPPPASGCWRCSRWRSRCPTGRACCSCSTPAPPCAATPRPTGWAGWGGEQYRRLDRLAGFFPQPLKLVALHHHVVRRVEERAHDLVTRIVAKFTVLGDARPLVRFCRKYGVRAVLNGHRHLSYQLRLPNGTVLMAAPSSTLGDELAHDPRPQFVRYDVGKTGRRAHGRHLPPGGALSRRRVQRLVSVWTRSLRRRAESACSTHTAPAPPASVGRQRRR